MKIAFIGGGNMGEAMLAAVLNNKIAAPNDITVAEINDERRQDLSEKYGVNATADAFEATTNKNVVILAIKPQGLDGLFAGMGGQFQKGQLVLSIIAGKSINALTSGLKHSSVARAMPNTPAQIGKGITVWSATNTVSAEQKRQAAAILGAMGQEIYTDDEAQLDMATAVSGSGPAYVFLFMEAMLAESEKLGLPPDDARRLVEATVSGAAEFAQQSGKDLAELRKMVTSPGGTTAAAIEVLETGGFKELVGKAIAAAHQRAKELGA